MIDVCEILRVLAMQTLDPNEGSLLASRASALYRQLASYDAERHNERFVASLNTHADRLIAAHRYADACDVLRDVVELYLQAYELAPRASPTRLANALRAYAKQIPRTSISRTSSPPPNTTSHPHFNPFSDILDIYAELYKRAPDKWHTELFDALSQCSDSVLKAGRVPEAIGASVAFVELYRVRFDASPRAHWAPFVGAMQGYVERLFRAKKGNDAIQETEELMRVYRSLWSDRSHAGRIPRDKLAKSLEDFAQRLFRVRRMVEGVGALGEIVEIYRRAYETDPARHHASLAEALDGLSDGLTTAGRVLEACAPSENVVDLYRRHLDGDPITFHAPLAKALARHSSRLRLAGKEVESWAMRVEIVDLYRDLDRAEPGLYHREIASALNACADLLTSSKRFDDACAAALEIVEYYRAVSGTSYAGLAELTRALTSYADRLERAGSYDASCEAIGEIVELDRRLYARYPTAHAWAMADSLDALAARLARAGRTADACRTAREAVAIDREHGTYERPAESEETKRACFIRVGSCCLYMIQQDLYLDTLDMAGWTLEALKLLRGHYDAEEQQSADRAWMKVEERKLRGTVKEMLQACARERIRIPSQSYPISTASSETLASRPRRNLTTRRPKLGWEINRYRSEKRSEGRKWL